MRVKRPHYRGTAGVGYGMCPRPNSDQMTAASGFLFSAEVSTRDALMKGRNNRRGEELGTTTLAEKCDRSLRMTSRNRIELVGDHGAEATKVRDRMALKKN